MTQLKATPMPIIPACTFSPFDDANFTLTLETIRASETITRNSLQRLLLSACFSAFVSDYKADAYQAIHFDAIYEALSTMRGINKHAVALWVKEFAPVTQEKETLFFKIDAKKSDALALSALSPEDRLNTFWAWAVTTGATKNWFEFDEANKKAAESVFDLERADVLVKNLIKKLNGAQYGNIANAIQKAYETEKLAVQLQS